MNPAHRLPLVLLALYAVVWTLCAVEPLYPADWLLENVLVFVFVPVAILVHRRHPFSSLSATCLFAFFCLHSLGTHYTYAEVPYDRWWQALTGGSLNELLGFQRNHYDRLVHFTYGLLTTPVWVEVLQRALPDVRGFWRWLVPLTFMMSHSLLYELIEWVAALLFGGDLGEAYLGTQGDIWDAHWDMLLASLGSAVTLALLAARGRLWTGAATPARARP